MLSELQTHSGAELITDELIELTASGSTVSHWCGPHVIQMWVLLIGCNWGILSTNQTGVLMKPPV